MRVDLIDVDDPRWTVFLERTAHDFYHLPGYVDLCAQEDGGTARALLVEDGGASMLLPLIVRHIPGGAATDAITPYGYPGPLLSGTDDRAVFRTLLATGLEVLRDAGLVSVFVRLHPILNPSPPDGIGTIVRHGDTVSIDLTLSIVTLWADTRANHRRQITRAIRDGYVARIDQSWEHLETFKRLYRQTMTRRLAAPGYFFGDAYFDRLRAALGDRLNLAVVQNGDAIAAAGLFVETDGVVQYHLSGTGDPFVHVQPLKLMIHFIRGWAKERGDSTLHLGGGVGSVNDSLFQFKLGFSPHQLPFRTMRIVLDEPAYRRLVLAHDPSLDPGNLRGFFPLYRSEPNDDLPPAVADAEAQLDG